MSKGQGFTACLATSKKPKNKFSNNKHGKFESLTEPGQELQTDFTGKLRNKNLNGDVQLLIAKDRFSRWPTAKKCKTSETEEVINFLRSNFSLLGIHEKKIKSDKRGIHMERTQRFLKFVIAYPKSIPETEQSNEQNNEKFNYRKSRKRQKSSRKY